MPAASSSSSSSTSCPPRPPPRLRLFHLHFRLANLANSSPSSSPTSQLSAHCWTSTCELPSSVCTTGPQPGSCPAQCAPLDLNRGPAQLSVHRWTSTWDLPSSVCTAGPQGQIECQKICQIELCQKRCQIECQKVCQIECPKKMSNRMPQDMPDRIPEDLPDYMPEDMPDRMPNRMPDRMPEDMPEDLPVTKCINVMVGITRSKVISSGFGSNNIYIYIHNIQLYINIRGQLRTLIPNIPQ